MARSVETGWLQKHTPRMSKTKSKNKTADPWDAEIEKGLRPGKYIPRGEVSEFLGSLKETRKKIEALGPDATGRVVRLFELFLAGCYDKAEECDDGIYLPMFFHDLFCSWIRARQDIGLSAEETVSQTLAWMRRDKHAFCFKIEKEITGVLNAEGYRLLVAHLEAPTRAAPAAPAGGPLRAIFEYDNSIRLPALQLKDIYRAKGDTQAYASLCERLGFSPRDCELLAELEMARKHWEKALGWVEKGLALEPARNWHNERSYHLAGLVPKLLAYLGRKQDATVAAWKDFEAAPSESTYQALMESAPRAEKAEWHEKAMRVASAGELGSFVGICVETKEWVRLADKIHAVAHAELEALSHYVSEPAAEGLAKKDPSAAAKLYRALGLRILNTKRSKYQGEALEHLENARRLYTKNGCEAEWDEVVKLIRENHSRKKGFLASLGLLEEDKPTAVPSFAERAQERWRKQTS